MILLAPKDCILAAGACGVYVGMLSLPEARSMAGFFLVPFVDVGEPVEQTLHAQGVHRRIECPER